jgi:hypothetical protein
MKKLPSFNWKYFGACLLRVERTWFEVSCLHCYPSAVMLYLGVAGFVIGVRVGSRG